MRLEDVAVQASISYEWCRKLEDVRDRRWPSPQALQRLGSALRLTAAEADYLHRLWDAGQRQTDALFDDQPDTVPESVLRVICWQRWAPSYVINRRGDILAWNAATCAVYGVNLDEATSADERNVVWVMFNNAELRRSLVGWEGHAKRILAECHSRWADMYSDPSIEELVVRLSETSNEFARWWPLPDPSYINPVRKELEHSIVGSLVIEQTVWQVADRPDLALVLSTPPPDTDSEMKLQRLADVHQHEVKLSRGPEACRHTSSVTSVQGSRA